VTRSDANELDVIMRKKSTVIDEIVGRNIRIYRLAKGLSQTELGEKLGITFQQIQKYEKGTNRVGSGRLYQISTILDMSVMSFFDGVDSISGKKDASPFKLLADPLSLRLVQSFAEISSRRTRSAVVALVERMTPSGKA
jgi:transcriptional regulator with XRE-family HTH domain